QIQNLNNTLNKTIKEKDNIINSNINHINQLQSNMQENLTQLNQTQSKLSFQIKYGTAKTRIQNQLSYKLGQAMIINSKSFLGYIRMPFVLSYIHDKHKQEQKIYQEKIKKDPSLKLPPLENYPDYKEALKLKNHLSYKLGQALIKANKTWYKGGYVKMWFEVGRVKNKIKPRGE
ncbi:alpha-2,3-sialyltransferase, partial [Campylobacter coli]